MKLQELRCPRCDGSINIDEEKNFVKCPYCGESFFRNNGKTEHTYNKNINVNKTVHEIYTNEADVIRAKGEVDEQKKAFKQVLIIFGSIFVLLGMMSLPLFFSKSCAQSQGKVNAGYYKDLIGKDYRTVQAHFEAAGFTDITLVDLDDSGLVFWNADKVDSISVGGDMDFDSTDWFDPNVKVIISYH